MKLGTLISVSGAFDFPQENRFHNITRIEDPKIPSPPTCAPAASKCTPTPQADRFTRLFLWFVVALLCLAAVA